MQQTHSKMLDVILSFIHAIIKLSQCAGLIYEHTHAHLMAFTENKNREKINNHAYPQTYTVENSQIIECIYMCTSQCMCVCVNLSDGHFGYNFYIDSLKQNYTHTTHHSHHLYLPHSIAGRYHYAMCCSE